MQAVIERAWEERDTLSPGTAGEIREAVEAARVIGSDGQSHPVTRIFPTGTKPVFDLRTRLGYRVRITGDHRVLTVGRGDVAVQDLTAGNRVMLRGAGFGRRSLSTGQALGIGVAAAEGYLSHSVIGGRAQDSLVLTTDAGEAPVLAAVASAVSESQDKMPLSVRSREGVSS